MEDRQRLDRGLPTSATMSIAGGIGSMSVRKILEDASKADDLSAELADSASERYKRFVLRFISSMDSSRFDRISAFLRSGEAVLAAIGAALGFFLILADASDSTNRFDVCTENTRRRIESR